MVGGEKNILKDNIIYYSHKSAFLLENPPIECEALGLNLKEISFLSKN